MLIDWTRKEKGSLCGFAVSIGVSESAVYLWRGKYKEFGEACAAARSIWNYESQKIGIKGMTGGYLAFHNATYIHTRKAWFGDSDEGPKDMEPDDFEFDYGDETDD